MTLTLSTEERLKHVDRELVELQRGFVEAATQLQEAPEVDGSFDERWQRVGERLRTLRSELRPEDFDKDQAVDIYQTLFDVRDTLDRAESSRDMDAFDQLLVQLERIRHVVRDALDEHVTGVTGDVGLVVKDLDEWLPGTSRETLAELSGVDRRTISRWAKKATSPPRRLRTVARLVAILRHNWTEDGVVAWFHRPRRDLAGRTPLAVLGDPNFDEDLLIAAARAGRSQDAS